MQDGATPPTLNPPSEMATARPIQLVVKPLVGIPSPADADQAIKSARAITPRRAAAGNPAREKFSNVYANGAVRGFSTYRLDTGPQSVSSPRSAKTPDRVRGLSGTGTTPNSQDAAVDDPRLKPLPRPPNPRRERREKHKQTCPKPVECPHQLGDMPSQISILHQSPQTTPRSRTRTPTRLSRIATPASGGNSSIPKPSRHLWNSTSFHSERQTVTPPSDEPVTMSSPSMSSTSTNETLDDSLTLDTDSQSLENPTPDLQDGQSIYSDDPDTNTLKSEISNIIDTILFDTSYEAHQFADALRSIGLSIKDINNTFPHVPISFQQRTLAPESENHEWPALSIQRRSEQQWRYRIYKLDSRISNIEEQLNAMASASAAHPQQDHVERTHTREEKFEAVFDSINERYNQLEDTHSRLVQEETKQRQHDYCELKSLLDELSSQVVQNSSRDTEARLMELDNDIISLKQRVDSFDLDALRADTKQRCEDLQARISDASIMLSNEIHDCTASQKQLEQRLTAQQTRSGSLVTQAQQLSTADSPTSNGETLQLMQDIQTLKTSISNLQLQLDMRNERLQNIEHSCGGIEGRIQQQQAAVQSLKGDIDRKHNELEERMTGADEKQRQLIEHTMRQLEQRLETTIKSTADVKNDAERRFLEIIGQLTQLSKTQQELLTDTEVNRRIQETLVNRIGQQDHQLADTQNQMAIFAAKQQSAAAHMDQATSNEPTASVLDEIRESIKSLKDQLERIESNAAGPSSNNRIEEMAQQLCVLDEKVKAYDGPTASQIAELHDRIAPHLQRLASVTENVGKFNTRIQSLETLVKKPSKGHNNKEIERRLNELESKLDGLSPVRTKSVFKLAIRLAAVGIFVLLVCFAVVMMRLPRQQSYLGYPPY